MVGNTTPQCRANYQSVFVDGKSPAPYPIHATINESSAKVDATKVVAMGAMGVAVNRVMMENAAKSGASYAFDFWAVARFGKVGGVVSWAVWAAIMGPPMLADHYWCPNLNPQEIQDSRLAQVFCSKERIGSPLAALLKDPNSRAELLKSSGNPKIDSLREAYCKKIGEFADAFAGLYKVDVKCEGSHLLILGQDYRIIDGRLVTHVSPPGYQFNVEKYIPLKTNGEDGTPITLTSTVDQKYKDYAMSAIHRNGMQVAEAPRELDSLLWTLRPKILDEAKKCGMNTDGPGDPLGTRKPNPDGSVDGLPSNSTH